MIPQHKDYLDEHCLWMKNRKEFLMENCNECLNGYKLLDNEYVVKCKYCLGLMKFESEMKLANIPKRFWKDETKVIKDIKFINDYFKNLNELRNSLIISSEDYVKKTSCCCYILKKAIENDTSVFRIESSEFNVVFKMMRNKNYEFLEEWLIENMNKQIVFIDELGSEECESYSDKIAHERLMYHIKDRYENDKQILITTQLDLHELIDKYKKLKYILSDTTLFRYEEI